MPKRAKPMPTEAGRSHLQCLWLLLVSAVVGCGGPSPEGTEHPIEKAVPDTNVSEFPRLDLLRSAPMPAPCIEGRSLTPAQVQQIWHILGSETKDLPELVRYLRIAGRTEDVPRMIAYLETGGEGHISPERILPSVALGTLVDMIKALGWLGVRLGEDGDAQSASRTHEFLVECSSPDYWDRQSIGAILNQFPVNPPLQKVLSHECIRSLGYFADVSMTGPALKEKLQAAGVWDDLFEGAMTEAMYRRDAVVSFKGIRGMEEGKLPVCSVHYWH